MMVSLRRLRAVLLLALVSALGWGIVGAGVVLITDLVVGDSIRIEALAWVFGIYGFLGFLAGAIYAVALALLPQHDGSKGLGMLRSSLIGAIGGLAVFLGLQLTVIDTVSPESLAIWGLFGAIGGATGLAIQRMANKGALPSGAAPPESLSP